MTPDDLDDHAAAHCSHLSPSSADWRTKMAAAIRAYGTPLSQQDRFHIYETSRIPTAIYRQFDLQVLNEALEKNHVDIRRNGE